MIATLIPATAGDPVQSVIDNHFYFRSGDDFPEMPYDMLRRMFASNVGPDLRPAFDARLVTLNEDGTWLIPIALENGSTAAATRTLVTVTVADPEVCDSVDAHSAFRNISEMNPGSLMFSADINDPVYRGIRFVAGSLSVRMRRGKRPRRILELVIRVYSHNMRAGEWVMRLHLARNGLTVRESTHKFLY